MQEIVNYGGWQTGNAMAFYVTGGGTRRAVSHELQTAMAAKLTITYELRASTQSPESAMGHKPQDEDATALEQDGIYLPMLINTNCVLP